MQYVTTRVLELDEFLNKFVVLLFFEEQPSFFSRGIIILDMFVLKFKG